MAQGAMALLGKNIDDALILAKEYDKVRNITDDQEQEPVIGYECFDQLAKEC